MHRTVAVLALLAVAGATTSLSAQGRRGDRDRDRGLVEVEPAGLRGGFYIGGGLGAGAEQYKYADETDFTKSYTKPSISIRAGGTPNQNVRLGGEIFGWSGEVQDGTEYFGLLLLTGQFYPSAKNGFFLKGGGGFGTSGTSYSDFGTANDYRSGFAWSVGAGFDIALSRSISIAPTVDFYQGTFTKRGEIDYTERVLNIGAHVTFQTGGRR